MNSKLADVKSAEMSQSPEEKSASGRKRKLTKVADLDEDEYRRRRARNNEAVKKCRTKSRQKTKEMAGKVTLLREENELLVQKVQILSKELTLLKDMFLTHATNAMKTSAGTKLMLVNTVAVKSDHGYSMPTSIKSEPSESSDEAVVDLSMHSRPSIILEKASNEK